MMKPVDAIEYVLRNTEQTLSAEDLCAKVEGIVNEQPFTPKEMLAVIESFKDRFEVRNDGRIRLQLDRLNDRVVFFQERLQDLRRGLRLMPFTNAQWLEVAIVYSIATRMSGMEPSLAKKGYGLWIKLEPLAEANPELKRQIELTLENGGPWVTAPVELAIKQLASVQLSPWEYVQQMRWLVSSVSRSGQFVTPRAVAELMTRLLGPDIHEVFDPMADASVVPVVLAHAAPGSVKATAVFMDPFARFFNELQARVLGAELNMLKWEDLGPGRGEDKRYSRCISAPPFGGRIKEQGALRAIEPYELAINQIMKRLAPSGRAVILVPESMLFSNSRAVLRKNILDQGILRAVISLPAGAFHPYSGVKTSILVLDRTIDPGSPVRFVDAAQYASTMLKRERTLLVEEIIRAYQSTDRTPGVLDVKLAELRSDEQVSWSMSRFVSLLQLDSIVAGSSGVDVIELGDVLHDDILSMGSADGLPLFQVSELSTDVLDIVRTAKEGAQEVTPPKGARRLDVAALLLARVGGKLKPTMFDPIHGAIAVGGNVFCFSVDSLRADPEYIAIELRSPTIQDQLDAYHQGSTIASIAKADLLRIRVRLPDLAEQRRLVRERKEAILLAKREEIARQEKLHGLSSDEWRILGAVEHSFRPVLALVEQPMETIRSLATGLNAEKQNAVNTELAKIDTGLDRMRGLFKLINDVMRSDKDSLRPVPVDLRRLFRTEVRALAQNMKGMRIYFQCETGLETPDGVIARVDAQQFALVVQNLLTNMAKHAHRPKKDEVTILVQVNMRNEPGRTWLVITIENDGKPFPDGFTHQDFVTFGKRLDATNGNGIGGFLIDRIIANHNGRFSSCNLEFDERADRSSFAKDQRLDENRLEPLDWETVSTHMIVQFTIELPIDHSLDHD